MCGSFKMPGLTSAQRQDYQQHVLIPNFKYMLDKQIMSVLYDIDGTSLIATNLSARSIGLSGWEASAGLSYRQELNSSALQAVFKTAFQFSSHKAIHAYCICFAAGGELC